MLGIVAASLLMLGIGTASLTPTKFAQKILLNHFTAIFSGNNEVPPVSTTGSGIASFQLVSLGHQEAINYELNLKNMKGVIGAHIHIGKQGENGPVVSTLFNPGMRGPPTGTVNGLLTAGTLTSSKLTGPLTGKAIGNLVIIIRCGELT